MPTDHNPAGFRLTKSLRFRLALNFALFCTLLFSGLGFVLRGILSSVVEKSAEAVLEEEWAALRGFVQVNAQGKVEWTYNPQDREEAAIVQRLQKTYMVANERGEVLENSEEYKELGFESPAVIAEVLQSGAAQFELRDSAQGQPFLIRQGVLREGRYSYFVALARNYSANREVINRFTYLYMAILPLFALAAAALAWFFARRALQPVIDVSMLAEQVSGSNLRLKLPLRGADDELDLLIGSFNRMVERLDKSFTQIAQFSTDVSHELRTPVTIVRGQLEVALMTAQSEQELRSAVEGALVDIDRLSQIIRALLQLAKAESGQIQLSLHPEDLAELSRQVLEELDIAARDKQVELRYSLPASAWMQADRIQIERLLYNLIDNALKYTPSGGWVQVEVTNQGENVVLIVSDSGKGIAPEHIPHLFDRFYRVPARQGEGEKGLGLGLNFVYWIVKAHNGSIQVESKVNEGSRFTVTFPAAPQPPSADHGNFSPAPGRSSHS
jgi:heavy metal sensor kinase